MVKTESALSFIPSDDRDTWVMAAMAIKDGHGEMGFDAWDNWSRSSEKYNRSSALSTWRSIRGAGITIASLFAEAIKYGWKDNGERQRPSQEQLDARMREAEYRRSQDGIKRAQQAKEAAREAGVILKNCVTEQHSYLDQKGFPEERGLVWRKTEHENFLIIPMRNGKDLTGIQKIDREGGKKFNFGCNPIGSEFLIDNSGPGASDWWAEGYASGLSLREILKAIGLRYRIHICFSAHNLAVMAKTGIVIADHDVSETGEKAALSTGLPYYLPATKGDDINDEWRRIGTFKASMKIREFLKVI